MTTATGAHLLRGAAKKPGTPLDADAFADLWREQRDDIRRFLYRRCPTSADELVSETFCRAWAGRSTYRPDAGPARGWLFRIAANVLFDHLRYERRRPVEFWPDMPPVPAGDVADEVADRVLAAAALASLTGQHRRVLVARFLLDLTTTEAAAVLEMPVGTVKSATSRAVAVARHALGEVAR